MKRIYAAAMGLLAVIAGLGLVWHIWHTPTAVPAKEAAPVYAYADVEHIMMSHPRYAEYHRLELEYNALTAQYQFEQWNYSRKAAAEGMSSEKFASVDAAGTAALNQELQAKIALKENQLNHDLQQTYEAMLQEKKKSHPTVIWRDNTLKIVNLQLKLQNVALSAEEKKAAMADLKRLMKESGPSESMEETKTLTAEINKAMVPRRQQAKQELEQYAKTVKAELKQRRDDSHNAFQVQLSELQNRPEPTVWNKQWKDKLEQKEKEMNTVKEEMMTDIRNKAGEVAQEQGIDMIFGEYEAVGTALDVTDDIIAKLA